MGSLYLNRLDAGAQKELRLKLHTMQHGKCFICQKPMDLTLHADSLDIDHIEPLTGGGKDDESNFALTHAACNRSKQASDLRVARVLSRFDAICTAAEPDDANLGDVLAHHHGSQHDVPIATQNGAVRISFPDIGRNEVIELPVLRDRLSGMTSFFADFPIEYLHHDDKINPRPIGKALRGLVEEFHRGNPQLHIGLGWLDLPKPDNGPRARVRVFDGQHKIAAQVLLGVRSLPIRVFVDPDRDRLLSANTNAGTTLRQVAFDKSVQRRLGGTILLSRIERFREDTGRDRDDWSFTERDLVKHFRGEARAVQRYVLDNVRNSLTHHSDNRLRDFIEFA
jgi:HNH endonuclease